jgi:catechol 2,3-dioxygenase-like lactoylglutathione lyase family enzyme
MANTFTPYAYVLAVPDLEKSTAFYRDVLGFRIDWTEAPDWRLAQRDSVRLMIGHCPDDKRAADIGSHSWFGYVEVNDVDQLHREFNSRGAQCTEPRDQPYGMREIIVTSPDGHRIVFGHDKQKR